MPDNKITMTYNKSAFFLLNPSDKKKFGKRHESQYTAECGVCIGESFFAKNSVGCVVFCVDCVGFFVGCVGFCAGLRRFLRGFYLYAAPCCICSTLDVVNRNLKVDEI